MSDSTKKKSKKKKMTKHDANLPWKSALSLFLQEATDFLRLFKKDLSKPADKPPKKQKPPW